MQTITHNQLVDILKNRQGADFVGVATDTDARLRKTYKLDEKDILLLSTGLRTIKNPNPDARKRCKGSLTIGAGYAEAVKREATRQGAIAEFTAAPLPRKGDYWLVAGKVIANDRLGKLYLRSESTPDQRKRHQIKLVGYYTPSGKALDYDAVELFIPPKRESKKQQDETGIDETIWVRDFAFDSIKKIRVAGRTYKLVKEISIPNMGGLSKKTVSAVTA